MAATYSIAVIGDWESVMGFRALGLDTYPVTSVEEARKTVHDLAKTNCAVIYLTREDILSSGVAPSDGGQPVSHRHDARHYPDPRPGRVSGHRKIEHPERHRTGCGCGYPVRT